MRVLLPAALRANLDLGRFGFALDGICASGDDNVNDNYQDGFRANTNYDFGFILFEQVLAAQTARGSFNAGNPFQTRMERGPEFGDPMETQAPSTRGLAVPLAGVR